jgi:hypothetical protein
MEVLSLHVYSAPSDVSVSSAVDDSQAVAAVPKERRKLQPARAHG